MSTRTNVEKPKKKRSREGMSKNQKEEWSVFQKERKQKQKTRKNLKKQRTF